MRIDEVKPSQRRAGRFLVKLEDGSILRLGEAEVLRFGLRAGTELDAGLLSEIEAAARCSQVKAQAAALSGRLYLRRDRQTAQGDLLPFYRNDTSPFHDGPPSQRHDKNGGSPGTPQRPPPFLLHILQVLL